MSSPRRSVTVSNPVNPVLQTPRMIEDERARRRALLETLGGGSHPRAERLNACPEDWKIDGREPNNWKAHRSALMHEGKSHASEDRARCRRLLESGDQRAIGRSSLVGVTDDPDWKRTRR